MRKIILSLGVTLFLYSCSQASYRVPSSLNQCLPYTQAAPFFKAIADDSKYLKTNAFVGKVENMKVHTNGESGYFKKIELIENAKPGTELNLAYFIFEDDYSSAFLTKKLIEASQKGVKVNLLIDYFMSVKYKKWLAYINSQKGIKVKLFRPASKKFKSYLKKDLEMTDAHSFLEGFALQDPAMIQKGLSSSKKLLYLVQKLQTEAATFKTIEASQVAPNDLKMVLLQKLFSDPRVLKQIPELMRMERFLKNYLRRLHHKKLLATTDRGYEFIIGGRNISDEYHIGLDEITDKSRGLLEGRNYPFVDSEVSGSVTSTAQGKEFSESYSRLWNAYSDLYETPGRFNINSKEYLTQQKNLQEKSKVFEERIEDLKKRVEDGTLKSDDVLDIRYSENLYHSAYSKKEIMHDWKRVIEEMTPEKGQIDMVMAYLYLYPEMLNSLEIAIKKGVDINLYTNSMTTTDLSIVNLASYQKISEWKKKLQGSGKIKFFELGLEKGSGSLHAKIFKAGNIVGVGSANLDPRTFLIDTNNVMFFDFSSNPEMAEEIFERYIGGAYPWEELTEQKAQFILQKAKEDPKNEHILELMNFKFFEDQI